MKKYAIYSLRFLLFSALFLAFWGLFLPLPRKGGDRVYLLDLSESFQSHLPEALEFIRQDSQRLLPQDRSALVVFGKESSLEKPLGSGPGLGELKRLGSQVDGGATDIEKALAFGLTLKSKDRAFQILLISDGRETRGKAQRALSAVSPHLYVKTFSSVSSRSIEILQIRSPLKVVQGEKNLIGVLLRGPDKTRAFLELEGEGFFSREKLFFEGGEEEISFTVSFKTPGFHRMVLRVPSGGIQEEIGLWCEPKEKQTLWITSKKRTPGEGGREITFLDPAKMPRNPSEWSRYSLVVLEDLPLEAFSAQGLSSLKSYVEKMGGSLLVVGGENSFSLGGYEESPVEDLLPVYSSPQKKSSQSLSLVLALDASGSMDLVQKGKKTKWEIALENIFPLKGLTGRDRVGVICFSQEAKQFSTFRRADQLEGLPLQLREVRPQGGTDLFAPVELGYQMLSSEKSSHLHLLVITDGKSQERSKRAFQRLRQWKKNNPKISASFLAVGSEPDLVLLQRMADLLGGRVISLKNFRDLGPALSKEIQKLRAGYIYRETFRPRVSGALRTRFTLPTFEALLITSLKDRAQVVLKGPGQFPLLALWSFGTGKVGALPSSLGKPWSAELSQPSQWKAFSKGLIQFMERKVERPPLVLSFDGEKRILSVEAFQKTFLNDLTLGVKVEDKIYLLHQKGPGYYESPPLSLIAGIHPCLLLDGNGKILDKMVISLSREEKILGPNLSLLDLLSGGKIVPAPPALENKGVERWDLAPLLLLLAILLFLAEEILVRWR